MPPTVKSHRSASGRPAVIVAATPRAFRERFRNPVQEKTVFRLYITGTTPLSCRAVANIRLLCDEHLFGRYDLDVIDIYQQPDEAFEQQIIAVPTLIKQFPYPARRIVGDLSNREHVLSVLNLLSEPSHPARA